MTYVRGSTQERVVLIFWNTFDYVMAVVVVVTNLQYPSGFNGGGSGGGGSDGRGGGARCIPRIIFVNNTTRIFWW